MPGLNRNQIVKSLGLIIGLTVLFRSIALLTPTLWRDESTVGLMGLRVMHGEFPVFFYGQAYMGALEGYLYASFFLLFPPSPLAMELLPQILSIIVLIFTFCLAKKIFNPLVGLVSAAYWILPGFYVVGFTHEARPHYILVLVFGSFLFLLTQHLLDQPRPPRHPVPATFLLGFLAGLGWWVNFLLTVYIIPLGLLLFFQKERTFSKKYFGLFLLAFLGGSFPLWLFNLNNSFPILGAGDPSLAHFAEKIKALLFNGFPILLGFNPLLFKGDPLEQIGFLYVGLVTLSGLVYFLFKGAPINRRSLSWTSAAPGKTLLWLLVIVTLTLCLITENGRRGLLSDDQRFLLPLYTLIPLCWGLLISRLWLISPKAALLVIVPALFFNVLGNIRHPEYLAFNGWKILSPEHWRAHQAEEHKEAALMKYLLDQGYRHLYANDILGKELTFKSQEALIFSDPYQEDYIPYATQVDGSFRAAYLFDRPDPFFEEQLQSLGGVHRKIVLPGGYQIYTDFQPPPPGHSLSPRLWRGSSFPETGAAGTVFDRNMASKWVAPQNAGAYIQVDLGKEGLIYKLSFIPGHRERPEGCQVSLSTNGRDWRVVAKVSDQLKPFFWSGPQPMYKIRRPRMECSFPPTSGRFIRIESTKRVAGAIWSIHELFFYSPAALEPATLTETDADRLVAFLGSHKIQKAYADHWLSAVIRLKSNRTVETISSNHFLDSHGRRDPLPQDLARIEFDPGTAFIVDIEGREDLEDFLSRFRFNFKEDQVGPFFVYTEVRPQIFPASNFLPKAGWKVSSNFNDGEAGRAIDRDPATRWSSGSAQKPGITFQVDLGGVYAVRGLSLEFAASLRDYPRDLRIFGSVDKIRWEVIPADWSSQYFWSGTHLLKLWGDHMTYLFPPREVRFLKLLQAGEDPTYYWSIHELEILGGDRRQPLEWVATI